MEKRKIGSVFFLLAFLFSENFIFPAERKVISRQNEFGGITEEHKIQHSEKDFEQFSKLMLFYDAAGNLRKQRYFLSELLQEQTGILIQEECFEDGLAREYKMTLTKSYAKKSGIKEIVEKMNPDGSTLSVGYSDGKNTAWIAGDSFIVGYPPYSLSFLDKEFFSDPDDKKAHENKRFYYSAKYISAKSFVHFVSDTTELDDSDREMIAFFAKFIGNDEIARLYTAKTTARSEGRKYTVYIQESLLPYVTKNTTRLIGYGIAGCDGKLSLLLTGLSGADLRRMSCR